jgi:hypothetical protein
MVLIPRLPRGGTLWGLLVGIAALAEPHLETPSAELIEHGDLFGQPRRMVQRQYS